MTASGQPSPVIDATGLIKTFGSVVGLDGTDFDLYPGEVLGVIGDNGAGKSTLIKCLSGAMVPDAGEIRIDGMPVHFRRIQDARAAGIETVYQSLAIVPALDIATNLYLGRELGGRPEGDDYYDAQGHVLYARLATSSLFLEGIDRLQKGAQTYRVAVMCAEEDPLNCHRRLLIGRVLRERGVALDHIRGDGTLQAEDELLRAEARHHQDSEQSSLFATPQEAAWRSTRSVSRRNQPPSSSER